MAAAVELARHGDVRMQVAERSECREYDALAGHGAYAIQDTGCETRNTGCKMQDTG
jgi:hypothetical protein